jgi:heme exporter protein A
VPGISRVEVDRVGHRFGRTVALRGVSLTFDPGTITFLLGPNGAGKSTLLSIVGTVMRATSGVVRYPPHGEDLDAVRAHVGLVAHESHLYRDLTGRQNVAFAAKLRGVDVTASWTTLAERTGTLAIADTPVFALSRGQKQRFALARALVHSPSLLLLDEPWTGLDAASAERLSQVLSEERARGAIVVVVSHEPEMAAKLGARCVELVEGRIARDAPPP